MNFSRSNGLRMELQMAFAERGAEHGHTVVDAVLVGH